jgi:hypothetical protein
VPEPDRDEEDNTDAARSSQPRSRKRARTTAPAEPREELDGEGLVDNLVAGRVKRVVKRSAKALAAEGVSEGSEDEDGLHDALHKSAGTTATTAELQPLRPKSGFADVEETISQLCSSP